MTTEEIFAKISAHMVKGMMAHDQLASYFQFLGFDGCSCCHKYHFLKETLGYRQLQKDYICRYNKLVKEEKVEDPNIIPEKWHEYTRQEVDVNSKRNAVRTALDIWYKWETSTHKEFCEYYKELHTLGDYGAAHYVKCLCCEVEEEVRDIERKMLTLNNVDYSLDYITGRQSYLKEKYSKKIKELLH